MNRIRSRDLSRRPNLTNFSNLNKIRSLNPLALAAAALGTATAAATLGAAAITLGAAAVTVVTVRALRAKRLAPAKQLTPSDGARPVVLVTGGSRGLGFAIASRFAAGQAVRLILASRNMDELQQAQATLLAQHAHLRPEDFHLVAADLSHPDECRRLITEAIARFGRIDILVNNAGIIEVGPIEAQPVVAFERAMQVNFFAALYTTWAALPHLRAQTPLHDSKAGSRRAAIVNISSIGGKIAVPHMLPYSASKFALTGFSEGLHAELRSKGIRVTTVCPGLMRTGGENHAKFLGNVDAEKRWFMFAAKTPGVSTTAAHAANKIFHAVAHGRAEITISPQAWLAARFAGLCPESLQLANALTNRYVLPPSPQQIA
jgi:NAD(P)-dependent dehydrogenase (short-subunit alcohol dehydrogenase family)